jgi:hypothetical protein
MIRFAHPAGRPPGVHRALRFCPAFAGMTDKDLFRVSLVSAHLKSFRQKPGLSLRQLPALEALNDDYAG